MRFSVVTISYDLDRTLNCGQAFRSWKQEDGSFLVMSGTSYCYVKSTADGILIWNNRGAEESEEEEYWRNYFAFDDNIFRLRSMMSNNRVLLEAYESNVGIFLLRQNPWETLISFIISQQKRIPQIKECIEKLCSTCGTYISEINKYGFPSPYQIEFADISDCSLGFRERYIKDVAESKPDLESLRYPLIDYDTCISELTKLYGVGDKVANCVALFALGHRNAFPIDIHIKRILELPDMKGFKPAAYGEYAGYIQQYLFNYALENNI